jgi:hypothetical protein
MATHRSDTLDGARRRTVHEIVGVSSGDVIPGPYSQVMLLPLPGLAEAEMGGSAAEGTGAGAVGDEPPPPQDVSMEPRVAPASTARIFVFLVTLHLRCVRPSWP